ncbi:hypothetical protein ZIOFF_043958 [Zingiber officinale]|uniref:Uncharacterized protein n=1 Tax=Zingiber officinale TaxID=94328 RepID=A0A8J5FWB4_ZINOF|nr:hypothetical protein ZIOFF_043958 [Zingiber officinale]
MAMPWAALVSSPPATVSLCRASPSLCCTVDRSPLTKQYASLSWPSSISHVQISSQQLCRSPSPFLPKRKKYSGVYPYSRIRAMEKWRSQIAYYTWISRVIIQHPNVGFAYQVQGVVDYLTSHGVRALPGRRYSTASLQGISLSFSNYKAATSARAIQYNARDEEVQSDEESFHTLAVLIEKAPGVLVYEDDYGPPYDGQPTLEARISEECPFILRAKLVPTGLSLEIPGNLWPYCNEVNAAWKFGLDIGIGVGIVQAAWTRRSKSEAAKRPNRKSWKQRTDMYMRPFLLNVFFSKRYIHAKVMHRGTSKVVSVASTNSRELRNTLPSLVDDDACRTIGQLIAERSKDADVFALAYEPKKNERIEGQLAIVLDTIKDNGIIFV